MAEMTVDEAIMWYEARMIADEKFGMLGTEHEAAKVALAALRAQKAQDEGRTERPQQEEHGSI